MKKNPSVVIGVTIDRSLSFHAALATSLIDNGVDVHMVSTPGELQGQLDPRVSVHQLEMERNPSPLLDAISFLKWIKLLRTIRPEMVIAGTPKASFLGIFAARLCRVPCRIYFVHGLRLETTQGALRKVLHSMEWLTFQNATQALAVSTSLRKKVLGLKLTRMQKISVIGKGSAHGVNIDKFNSALPQKEKEYNLSKLGLTPGIPVIGFVGRLTTEKGINELKEALISLHSAGRVFQVLIIGAAEDRAGENLLQALEEASIKVSAPGRVADTSAFYKLMDIFCLPTYREGFGTVILEAFASGVPVISTKVTGVKDLIDDQSTGILVSPRDSAALMKALDSMLKDPQLANQLKENATAFVLNNFEERRVTELQTNYILDRLGRVAKIR